MYALLCGDYQFLPWGIFEPLQIVYGIGKALMANIMSLGVIAIAFGRDDRMAHSE